MKKNSETGPELKIVNQTRTMRHHEYDFARGEVRLTLRVEEVSGTPDRWRVDARGRAMAGGVQRTATAEASTRVEAVRAVGAAWRDQGDLATMFDWNAVEELLVRVRAL